MHSKLRRLGVVAAAGVALLATAQAAAQKVLQLPIRTDGPKSLDPVAGSTTYDNLACAQMYETQLIAKYNETYKITPKQRAIRSTTTARSRAS